MVYAPPLSQGSGSVGSMSSTLGIIGLGFIGLGFGSVGTGFAFAWGSVFLLDCIIVCLQLFEPVLAVLNRAVHCVEVGD